MKLPISMLLDFVSTSLSAEQVGDLLTMAGFELEGMEEVEGEPVLDIKVMANRGDGLSALGLAREVLAKDPGATPTDLYRAAAERFVLGDESEPCAWAEGPQAKVAIETPSCARYACRMFESVSNGDSPEWLQARLRKAGQRPISLLVDLTNYVMLEMGQPLHAFDADRLADGRIVVRQAVPGETLTTLNGVSHQLQPHHMMICDGEKPVAVAGVMGGEESEVGPSTRRMLLESASFVNDSIRRTRRDLGLNTEASYRFERSVDPEGVVAALNRFAILYAKCLGLPDGGFLGKGGIQRGVVDVYPNPPEKVVVRSRASRANLLLGLDVAPALQRRYLEALGFGIEGDGEPFVVTVPSWRPDVEREDDVAEEIGRVHGYERIPEVLPQGTTPRGGVFGFPALVDRARQAMLRCGFTQLISHSLRDRHPLDFPEEWRIGPRNPHSPEASLLRDSLLPCLSDAALRNGAKNLHLFEIGNVFLKGEYQFDESTELGILSTGALFPTHWSGNEPPVADFYSLKGVVEELALTLGDDVVFDYPRNPDRRFHPTRQSGVLLDEGRFWAGTVGQIHPEIAERLGLPEETYLAELDLLVFEMHPSPERTLRQFSRNPAVRRDMAFLLPKSVPYAKVHAAVEDACGADLERQWLFDVYEGQGIPEGSHSLAIALQLRRMGENLTDEEANKIRDRAVAAVQSLGGVLR